VLEHPRELINADIVGESGELLDHGLVAYFPKPRSFTGEDCAEINLHGSPFLVQKLLELLNNLGARLANPGEFSERAFHNGKFDLTQVEAIADLIAAESEAQASAAREQLKGRLAGVVSDIGEPLRNILAEIEANLDFPDEDISPLSREGWLEHLKTVEAELRSYISTYKTGRILREGAVIAIVGLPNAGKSQLLNQLLGEERVIVTPTPGTTRDSVEEAISIDGIRVRLVDTAGLAGNWQAARTPDEIEQLGIGHSWKRIEQADLVLYLLDATVDSEEQEPLFERVSESSQKVLVIANKQDLLADTDLWRGPSFSPECPMISALDGSGIAGLRKLIYDSVVGENASNASVVITTTRHVEALKVALGAIVDATKGIEGELPAELVSVDIRGALTALEEIIGVTATEDILGRIFSKFCIGK
jgi:tRNA modification GTPase